MCTDWKRLPEQLEEGVNPQEISSAVSDRHGILGEMYYCHITNPIGPGASAGRSADSILPCHTCHSEANGQLVMFHERVVVSGNGPGYLIYNMENTLQSRGRRFDSDLSLHFLLYIPIPSR